MKPGLVALALIAILGISIGLGGLRHGSVLDSAYSQVVVVACPQEKSYGTGWFIDHSHVVTAYHVVANCASPQLLRSPWSSSASLQAYDPDLDVALLKVEDPPGWARGLPLSESVAIGDSVYVVGYPIQLYEEVDGDINAMSEIPRVQKATVTWINPERRIFEFSPGTDAGNSGGPIISVESGGVVGIVVYARPGVVSEGYYGLRMDGLAEFLSAHGIHYRVAGGHNWAAWLGLGALAGLGALILLAPKGVMPR